MKSFLVEVANAERVKVHVVRNCFFGKPDDFSLFNGELKGRILDRGGSVLDFPVLAKRCVDPLYSDRLSIARAVASFPFGNRLELQRWRRAVHELFAKAGVYS